VGYEDLVKALRGVPVSWHGGYKGSVLSRKMLLDGHDAAFQAKSTKLTLLRSKHQFGWSEFRLCITDTDTGLPAEETSPPFKVYGDGFKVKDTCYRGLKRMTPGVAGQQSGPWLLSSPRTVNITKEELNVEVLRMLMKKNAMALHEQFKEALSLWLGDIQSERHAWAALMTTVYRERFARMGLRVEFNVRHSCDPECDMQCPHVYYWLEYVDLDIAPNYQSRNRHGDYSLAKNYVRCSSSNSMVRGLMTSSGLSFKRDLKVSKANYCAAVESASPRDEPDYEADCKCPDQMSVYCGSQYAASRKFSSKAVVVARCPDPYCSKEACPNQI